MIETNKVMNPVHFRSDQVDSWIRINPESRIRIPDHFWSRQLKLKGEVHVANNAEVCALSLASFWK